MIIQNTIPRHCSYCAASICYRGDVPTCSCCGRTYGPATGAATKHTGNVGTPTGNVSIPLTILPGPQPGWSAPAPYNVMASEVHGFDRPSASGPTGPYQYTVSPAQSLADTDARSQPDSVPDESLEGQVRASVQSVVAQAVEPAPVQVTDLPLPPRAARSKPHPSRRSQEE